jgi:hypothetical protein
MNITYTDPAATAVSTISANPDVTATRHKATRHEDIKSFIKIYL